MNIETNLEHRRRVIEETPGVLCLFRVGDFYEAYESDSETIGKSIGLTITERGSSPVCGFPYHALDGYLNVLIRKGHRVAVCEPAKS